jgi:hypothetical protein
LTSIKAVFVSFSCAKSAFYPDGLFGSFDPTNTDGSYQLEIAGEFFPQNVINTRDNKAGVLSELLKACTVLGPKFDTIFSKHNHASIDDTEFNYPCTLAPAGVNLSNPFTPGKFFVGFHCERQYNNDVFFSGINTGGVPITVSVNYNSVPIAGVTCNIFVVGDTLIEIDLENNSQLKIIK